MQQPNNKKNEENGDRETPQNQQSRNRQNNFRTKINRQFESPRQNNKRRHPYMQSPANSTNHVNNSSSAGNLNNQTNSNPNNKIVFCHDFQNKSICGRLNCKFLHYTLEEEDHYRNTGELIHFVEDENDNSLPMDARFKNPNNMNINRYTVPNMNKPKHDNNYGNRQNSANNNNNSNINKSIPNMTVHSYTGSNNSNEIKTWITDQKEEAEQVSRMMNIQRQQQQQPQQQHNQQHHQQQNMQQQQQQIYHPRNYRICNDNHTSYCGSNDEITHPPGNVQHNQHYDSPDFYEYYNLNNQEQDDESASSNVTNMSPQSAATINMLTPNSSTTFSQTNVGAASTLSKLQLRHNQQLIHQLENNCNNTNNTTATTTSAMNHTYLYNIIRNLQDTFLVMKHRVEANEIKLNELSLSNEFLMSQFQLSHGHHHHSVNSATVTQTTASQQPQVISAVSMAPIQIAAPVSLSTAQTQILTTNNVGGVRPQLTITPTMEPTHSMGITINTSQPLSISNTTQPIITYPVMTHSILPH